MGFDYIPRVDIKSDIGQTKLNTEEPNGSFRMNKMGDSTGTSSFKDMMVGMTQNLNDTVKAPDQVLTDAMLGNGADVHDVVLAMSKAEIGLNIATQATTKVLQAYEKITSIQV